METLTTHCTRESKSKERKTVLVYAKSHPGSSEKVCE
jgi:hypothetical protein